jgi:hypothetical protein
MNTVRLFNVLYCGALALIVLLRHADQRRYLELVRSFETPAAFLGRWVVPRFNDRTVHILGLGFVGCVLLGGLALSISRLALLAAAGLYFLYFSQFIGLAYVARKSNLVPQILALLACCPEINAPWKMRTSSLLLTAVETLIALVYFSSAFCKLRNSGLAWMSAKQMQGILIFHHLYYDMPLSLRIAHSTRFCRVIGTVALIFEISFIGVIALPRLALLYAIAGLLFHLGTWRLMKIDYLTYFGPAYLVFFVQPLASVLQRAFS